MIQTNKKVLMNKTDAFFEQVNNETDNNHIQNQLFEHLEDWYNVACDKSNISSLKNNSDNESIDRANKSLDNPNYLTDQFFNNNMYEWNMNNQNEMFNQYCNYTNKNWDKDTPMKKEDYQQMNDTFLQKLHEHQNSNSKAKSNKYPGKFLTNS